MATFAYNSYFTDEGSQIVLETYSNISSDTTPTALTYKKLEQTKKTVNYKSEILQNRSRTNIIQKNRLLKDLGKNTYSTRARPSVKSTTHPEAHLNTKHNKKSYFKRLLAGLKKGWATDTLPPHLLKLQLHPLIRIFRVVGGVIVLSILTQQIERLGIYAVYVVTFISFIYGIYMLYLSVKRFKHILYILKSEELEVRNSPLDKFASYAAKWIYCVKGDCEAGAPVCFYLVIMAGLYKMFSTLSDFIYTYICLINIIISSMPFMIYYYGVAGRWGEKIATYIIVGAGVATIYGGTKEVVRDVKGLFWGDTKPIESSYKPT